MDTITVSENAQRYGIRYVTLSPDYVSGFCDGEATFTYSRQRSSIRLRFAIGLHEEDKPLIFAIQSFFGVGGLYWAARKGRAAPTWTYCVSALDEIGRIIEHFSNFPLQGKKAECFSVWKQMYELKRRNNPSDWIKLADLAWILSSFTTKGRKSVKPFWMKDD